MTVTNVLGETRKVANFHEGGYHDCPFCLYPTLGPCGNPRCTANPIVSLEIAQRWAVDDAKRAAEKAEREYLDRARAASYKRAF